MARRLGAFGFTVLAHDPYADTAVLAASGVRLVSLPDLFEQSHAVSLHAPLTPSTRHLVDAELLARTRHGVVLVNTSRGALVDQEALADAIERGQVAAAALDVFEPEPLPVSSRLRSLPEVLLTPHVAFFSDDSLQALQRLASEEAGRALAGEPLRCRVG